MSTVVVTQGTTRTVQVATAGPQGVRGAQGWVWRGPWDADADYAAGVVVGGVVTVGAEAVTHAGSAWLAVADSTGVEPTALAAEWELIAEKGEPNTLTVTATTLPVGELATAVISGDAPAQAIAFGLPTGATGATGPTGPANELTVGTVETTAAGTNATVTFTGTAPAQTVSWTLPRGADGLGVGTLGNLLTAAQATPSTGQYTLSGATEAAGLVLTASGSGAYSAYATVASVVAGQTWTAMATLAPTGRAVATRISWRNSGGAEISAVAGDSIAAGATGVSMAVGVAPAGTVSVRAYPAYSGTGAAGDAVTVAKVSFHGGAGGEWVAPGVPVPNLGRRVRRPNTADVAVEVWDPVSVAAGRWQTVHYDSGWRDLSSAMLNGWTASSVHQRRLGNRVTLRVVGLSGSAATSNIPFVGATAGFKLGVQTYWVAINSTAANAVSRMWLTTSGNWNADRSAVTASSFEVSWLTNESLPTTLPGDYISEAPA